MRTQRSFARTKPFAFVMTDALPEKLLTSDRSGGVFSLDRLFHRRDKSLSRGSELVRLTSFVNKL